MEKNKKLIRNLVIGSLIVIVLIILAATSFRSVPTGFVGVRTQFGAVIGKELSPGLQVKKYLLSKISKSLTAVRKK